MSDPLCPSILPLSFAPDRRCLVVGRSIPMDGSRFDAWSRTLVTAHSRRGLTRLLTGPALGGPVALLAEPAAVAKHRRHKKHHGGTTTPPVSPPPSPPCPQPAAPHFCASANTCLPACPTGKVFEPASCTCRCAVPTTCCLCGDGSHPFCSAA